MIWQSKQVADTAELRRILEIPRRTWTDEDLEELADRLTALLKTPDGTMSLRPKQALALHDAGCFGGLVGNIRVGGGKSLISLLVPRMFDPEPANPLLILPASLIQKTEDERRRVYAPHWRVCKHMPIVSYESLGRVQQAEWLEWKKPDLIVLDEAHRAKNKRAGVTKRLIRYMREHPKTRVVILSGTLMKASLEDFAHLLRWALKENAPIPSNEGELKEWADALDEGGRVNPLQRYEPGALLRLATPEDWQTAQGDELRAARLGFHRRLTETPGVVATSGEQVSCSLYIRANKYPVNQATEANFQTLRAKWETPDGWALSEAVAIWRHARELALGFHYVWDPRPPDDWLIARRNWAKFVRQVLAHSRTLDTELQVANAVRGGALQRDELDAWDAVRPHFTRQPKALWHDDSAIKQCQAWIEEGPGIVWCEHTFFAEALARLTGVPYYGAQGVNSRGEPIEHADPKKPLIASVAANSTGRNLQTWSRNLITSCPTGAAEWEQLLGRTHRDGQKADEVTVDVLFGCFEHWDAWNKARALALATQDSMGASQKLLLADCDFPTEADLFSLTGARWRKNVSGEPG